MPGTVRAARRGAAVRVSLSAVSGLSSATLGRAGAAKRARSAARDFITESIGMRVGGIGLQRALRATLCASLHTRASAFAIGGVRSSLPALSRASPARHLTMCDAAPAPAAPPADEVPPFAKLDVRVGTIVEAWPHPESVKLWCERIDVGEPEPREIATGVRAWYESADQLEGRKVLVLCNLKAAKLAGFASNGMVLCASSEDRSVVEFVEVPADAQPGERATCEGMVAEPATPNQARRAAPLVPHVAAARAPTQPRRRARADEEEEIL